MAHMGKLQHWMVVLEGASHIISERGAFERRRGGNFVTGVSRGDGMWAPIVL